MAVIAAWVITGIGIFFLANTFRVLSVARPDATAGIYAYARLGFGRFAGFQMAWSYWLCNIFGNVGYAVLLMDALDYFFPGYFTGGNNLWSVIGGSIVIWIMNFAVLRGVHQAAFINAVGTICKLLPIALFILVMIFVFRWDSFTFDMCGTRGIPADDIKPLGGMLGQIKSTMLVTLWAFIGIECAVVVSGRAKSQSDVGKATVLGFLGCLAIYALLSILPFGFENHLIFASINFRQSHMEKAIEVLVDSRYDEVVELIDKDEFIKDPLDAYENKIFCKGAPLKTGVIWDKNYIEEDK
jgi:arginine:ornithine antiporter/lysine permease